MNKTDSIKGSRIISKDIRQSNDTRETGLNNNDLIIGPSGAGKTRGYVIPNILHAHESIIVTDTKGSLRTMFCPHLQQQGYEVIDIDIADLANSRCGYDPLDFIRVDPMTGEPNEQDVRSLAALISPATSLVEPYWELAAQANIAALIAFVMTRVEEQDRSMATVCALASYEGSGRIEAMFADLMELAPDCLAARLFRQVHCNAEAEKMVASVRGIEAEKLAALSVKGAISLYRNARRIDFSIIGQRKTAVFLKISDSDRSMDALANIFYSQAFQVLNRTAESYPDNTLPIPVRIILDDFATNTVIPNFDKVIATIRSRGICVSLIVQDFMQLYAIYGDCNGAVIANNCDTWLYLGGRDIRTADDIATRMNKRLDSVLNMPVGDMVLLVRGREPVRTQRYVPERDPLFLSLNEDRACAKADDVKSLIEYGG